MPRQYAAQLAKYTEMQLQPGFRNRGLPGESKVWTFIDFEAPDDIAEELAHAIPDVLKPAFGWWADKTSHVPCHRSAGGQPISQLLRSLLPQRLHTAARKRQRPAQWFSFGWLDLLRH